MERRYRDAARQDFLTGVGNRRDFEDNLQRQFLRAKMSDEPLSLIMVVADNYKEYNDLYGHRAGDHCLRGLAQTLVSSCRPTKREGRNRVCCETDFSARIRSVATAGKLEAR